MSEKIEIPATTVNEPSARPTKQFILSFCLKNIRESWEEDYPCPVPPEFSDVEEVYDLVLADEISNDRLDDEINWFRNSFTHETRLECPSSRHYEAKSVARLVEGIWIGWTFWFGGGKYGEPSAMEWLNDAYFLHITNTRLVEVHDFEKIEEP